MLLTAHPRSAVLAAASGALELAVNGPCHSGLDLAAKGRLGGRLVLHVDARGPDADRLSHGPAPDRRGATMAQMAPTGREALAVSGSVRKP